MSEVTGEEGPERALSCPVLCPVFHLSLLLASIQGSDWSMVVDSSPIKASLTVGQAVKQVTGLY